MSGTGELRSLASTSTSLQAGGSIPIAYDLSSHHALGGGSYVFKSHYAKYLKSLLPHPDAHTEINIIIQPNCSPHVGTLCSLGLAFVLARRMSDLGLDVLVVCDLWDRVKGEQLTIDGLIYQRSIRDTGKFDQHLPEYHALLQSLSDRYGVPYKLRVEEEFLAMDGIPGVLQKIIQSRENLAKYLAPSTGSVAIRASCPKCGLVDKYGVKNLYSPNGSDVSFECPFHGRFSYNTETDAPRFLFNCQLFNLIFGYFYENVSYNWIEICGSDYAGFWQEQLFWRFLSNPAIIVYTPLISDWSGSKISKSLYLQKTAYDYLVKAKQEYLLSYDVLRREQKDLTVLWREIELWVDEPYRLFRGYSLHYLHLLFEQEKILLGVIHMQPCEPETE
ncbi:hypothetical protein DV738_g2408, partial [Chaetothyriales sp. CBS 135597]